MADKTSLFIRSRGVFMRLVSEYCLWWVFFGCSSTACFGGDNLTVEAAIAEAKQKKKYEFAVAAAPTPLPGAWVNKSQIPTEPRPDLPKPKLWSIWGVNDQYQAEIVYEGKVHQVPLRVGERFQHWVISDYSNQSLTLTTPWRSPSSTSMSNKLRGRDSREKQIANELTGAQSLTLRIMGKGQSIANYLGSDGSVWSTPQRQSAASLPAMPAPQNVKN
jgi:hypothetical protein